jgi:hypothetical protein
MISKEFLLGQMKVEDIKDNSDGTSTIIFNVTGEFKENYMEAFGLEEWSQDHFDNLIIEALDKFIDRNTK